MKSTFTKKIFILTLAFLSLFWLRAQDTFSIVALDPATGEIGSAGASCVDGAAQIGGVIIISGIIPGKGAINGQAWICIPHVNLNAAMTQMSIGSSPQEIIDWLQLNDQCQFPNQSPFDPEFRQWGIVDFDDDGNPRSAGFTGTGADNWKGHITGNTYSIQGNILIGEQVLNQMEANFNATSGSLAEKLMAAMQGANIPGADARCLARGTSSTSAFLRVFKPDDDMNEPFLELNVEEMPFGEEPIDSLQTLFDEWFVTNTVQEDPNHKMTVSPNPAKDFFEVYLGRSLRGQDLTATVFDIMGKELFSRKLNPTNTRFVLNSGAHNMIVLKVTSPSGAVKHIEKIVLNK